MPLFAPDGYFSSITTINISRDLVDRGLTSVLLDIDNTIRSRATGGIPKDVRKWLSDAKKAGVSFCLLSNNWHGSVREVAHELEMPIVAKAMKPLPFAYMVAMRRLGAKRKESVAVGDQLFTDVLGAHLAGIKSYLVLPLAEADLKHTLMLRNLEHALMGNRVPQGAHQGAHIEGSGMKATSPTIREESI